MQKAYVCCASADSASSAYAQEQEWYIQGATSDRVHLRAAQDHSAESLGLYFQRTTVERKKDYFCTKWVWVRIGAAEGYIHTDCLTDTPLENLQLLYCVNNPCSTRAYLRSEPTTQSSMLGEYNNGTSVRMLEETKEHWCYIQIGERSGYIRSEMLSRQEEQTSRVTNIVGRASDGSYIHAYPAPNAQVLYFTALEEVNDVRHEDVNFDGQQD